MKKSNYFWVGFADLMTSLFFVMLVLFAVAIGYLKYKGEANAQQLKKIKEIQTSTQQLPDEYFTYQPQYKRFKLNRLIAFGDTSAVINTNDYDYLLSVGREINQLIHNNNNKYKDLDIKYLVVIEGMASHDNYKYNFELSYKRALSLYRLWKSRGIIFDPEVCELQIAGSGIDGVREYSGVNEGKNRRFLIHIVPKIGKIIINE